MKRTKLMAGTLVLATALLGTGYAAWTDVLEVNATVSTGTLDVQFANVKVKDTVASDKWLNEKDLTTEGQTVGKDTPEISAQADGADATIENDVLTFDFSNVHPNSNVEFSVEVVNKGSVPAVIDTVTVEDNVAAEILLDITGANTVEQGNADTIATMLQAALDGVTLQPTGQDGDTKELTFTFSLDEELANDTQNQSTGVMKLELNWAQEDTDAVNPAAPTVE